VRSFDLQADGSYIGQEVDFASLSLDQGTGIYTLTEPDGTATIFNSAGKIDYIEDTNGNRITTTYSDGNLTSLTDAFGNSLNFEYNGNGRISTATDSDGRSTSYGYDETGELLTSVADEAGTTTYTYSGSLVESITDPNGTTINYAYDEQGRLTQQSISGGEAATEVTSYSYGEAGEVTVTDALGNQTQLLLNENGQLGKLTDANGRLINFSYDSQGNLTEILAPDNNSTRFSYDDRGNVTSQIDAAGNTTEFTYDQTYNQLTGFSDPLGNGINYSYDKTKKLELQLVKNSSAQKLLCLASQ
jgi:YD repeat-containing protein